MAILFLSLGQNNSMGKDFMSKHFNKEVTKTFVVGAVGSGESFANGEILKEIQKGKVIVIDSKYNSESCSQMLSVHNHEGEKVLANPLNPFEMPLKSE